MGEDGLKKMRSTSEAKVTWRRDVLFEDSCLENVAWEIPCEEEEGRSRGLVGFLEKESWIEVVVSVSMPVSAVDFGHEVGFENWANDRI